LEIPKPNVLDELSPRLRFMILELRPEPTDDIEKEPGKKKGWFSKLKNLLS